MMINEVIFTILFMLLQTSQSVNWKWNCNENNLCIRLSTDEQNSTIYNSLEVCRLSCGKNGAIWPLPTIKFEKSNELIDIDISKIKIDVVATKDVHKFVEESIKIFRNNLQAECKNKCVEAGKEITITITIYSNDLSLSWNTNESYNIKSDGTIITIIAETYYGARHGLESLSQLFATYSNNNIDNLVTLKNFEVQDKPYYPHRSLLLDTTRNYLSLNVIKTQIDGMASSKMNVLHLHATDSQSFPYVSQRVPNITKFGAYSEQKVYTPSDIEELLHYAKVRGVRIIMEIDAPAHASNGWQWGPDAGLGNLAVCINQQPWRSYCIQPPCGQLNPANPNVYNVLQNLYSDIIDQFPKNEIFHMGGDEVFIDCWNSSKEIIDYLKSQGKGQSKEDFLDLWSEFQSEVLKRYDEAVGNKMTPILLWSSDLTNPEHIEKYLDKNRYIIETWVPSTDPLPSNLLKKGYKLIISTKNAWYLDHGFWGTTKYYTWRTAYDNKLIQHNNVLGGEVCMWGEYVDDNGINSKIWPRAAAAAERLWSNPTSNTQTAEPRMYRHRERLVSRGIDAAALVPYWCYQNEGQCL